MSLTLESWSKCYVFHNRSKSSKFVSKVYECLLLGYDSNSCAYHVFNKDSSCVETTCDMVFDETNVSQVEQYDIDVVDDKEAPCDALQRMVIGDVRPHDLSEPQASHPPKRYYSIHTRSWVRSRGWTSRWTRRTSRWRSSSWSRGKRWSRGRWGWWGSWKIKNKTTTTKSAPNCSRRSLHGQHSWWYQERGNH
jgi:hypothetical protein